MPLIWSKSKVRDVLCRQANPVFAVFDAARVDGMATRLRELGAKCLYSGDAADVMTEHAPYVFPIAGAGQVTALDQDICNFVMQGIGNAWGIFIEGDCELDTIRDMLRKLTTVSLPQGSVALFRFFDPRVLRVFLGTCDHAQLQYFFNGIRSVFVEDCAAPALSKFSLDSTTSRLAIRRYYVGEL